MQSPFEALSAYDGDENFLVYSTNRDESSKSLDELLGEFYHYMDADRYVLENNPQYVNSLAIIDIDKKEIAWEPLREVNGAIEFEMILSDEDVEGIQAEMMIDTSELTKEEVCIALALTTLPADRVKLVLNRAGIKL